jgi:predicted NAD/FAD-dependent oxidoreductase
MAGLTAATELRSKGWTVVLLDKGRKSGGRMATRGLGESRFDYGAQFFTVRDPRFRDAVDRWQAAGWVQPWFAENGHTRYKSVGGMNALAAHLAEPFDVRTETKVSKIVVGDEWQLTTETGKTFQGDALILTPPAPQSLALLGDHEIASGLIGIDYDPCFALLVTLEGPGKIPSPGYVRPQSGPIEWIADNTQKGVSRGSAALTIHARADFSRLHLEELTESVAKLLLDAAQPWLEGSVTAWHLHRWRYSKPVAAMEQSCLFSKRLAIAGDGFAAPRIEGAFLSGLAAAGKIAGAESS